MKLLVIFLVFTMFWESSLSVMCYQCQPERLPYKTNTPLCEHFNYTEMFLVKCDSSTMCFKRETFLDLGNGMTTRATQRGCAPQTMSGDQKKVNGKWQPVNNIYDVYSETCQEDPSDRERITKTVHCYCRGDLCNSAAISPASIALITTSILFVINK